VAKTRVEAGREHEAEAATPDALRDLVRGEIDLDTKPFENVGGAALTGHRAVTVLGDADAGTGDDEGGGRRDVEGAGAVAAGAAGVDEWSRIVGKGDRQGVAAHRRGETGDLGDRLTAHAKGRDERGDLGRGRLTRHDRVHRRGRLGGGELAAVDDRLD